MFEDMFEDIVYVYKKECPSCKKVGRVSKLKINNWYHCEHCGKDFKTIKTNKK